METFPVGWVNTTWLVFSLLDKADLHRQTKGREVSKPLEKLGIAFNRRRTVEIWTLIVFARASGEYPRLHNGLVFADHTEELHVSTQTARFQHGLSNRL